MRRWLSRFFAEKKLFPEGEGSVDNPFLIEKVEQLRVIGNQLDAHYKLIADIDMQGVKWSPLGNRKERFTGTFNGNGYRIVNLKVKAPAEDYIGFFGFIGEKAQIWGLALENCHIQGHNFVGGLAAVNIGIIKQCYVLGEVKGRSHVGGLNGWNVEKGRIEQCFFRGTVKGEDSVGGLVGANFDTVSQCYVAAEIEGKRKYLGGVVGLDYLNYKGDVKECYYDQNISGEFPADEGSPRPTFEMQKRDTFSNWDFDNIWYIEENKSYPLLRIFTSRKKAEWEE